jgi:hypothetical protein
VSLDNTKPWFELAPDLDAKPGSSDSLAIHWLTFAEAHQKAYAEAMRRGPEEAARASHTHLMPYFAGLTVAALALGKSPQWIHGAIADGAQAAEWTWQWLREAGVDPAEIRSAADLVPMVDRGIAERGVTHQVPPIGSGTFPCCNQTPFQVPPTDRMTEDSNLVTCSTQALL